VAPCTSDAPTRLALPRVMARSAALGAALVLVTAPAGAGGSTTNGAADARGGEVEVRGGRIVFEVDGTPVGTGDAASFSRGETLEQVLLAVVEFVNVGGHHFTVVLEGQPPEGVDVGPEAEAIGESLLTPDSYDRFDAAIGTANPFGAQEDNILLDGPLAIADDAPLGTWTLHLRVREVDLDVEPARYGDAFVVAETVTFEITADEPWPPWTEVAALVGLFLAALLLLRLAGRRRVRASR
jgi:hypothetical protein